MVRHVNYGACPIKPVDLKIFPMIDHIIEKKIIYEK